MQTSYCCLLSAESRIQSAQPRSIDLVTGALGSPAQKRRGGHTAAAVNAAAGGGEMVGISAWHRRNQFGAIMPPPGQWRPWQCSSCPPCTPCLHVALQWPSLFDKFSPYKKQSSAATLCSAIGWRSRHGERADDCVQPCTPAGGGRRECAAKLLAGGAGLRGRVHWQQEARLGNSPWTMQLLARRCLK